MNKPMSCQLKIDAPVEQVYKTLLDQQLLYFQNFDSRIQNLHNGVKIQRDFYTKLNGKAIKGSTAVERMEKDKEFTLISKYGNNRIIQSFQLERNGNNTLIAYSEQSIFSEKKVEMNYGIVSWFYTFSFKRQMKKRLKRLGELACQ